MVEESPIYETIIFLILNLVFISVMLIFVWSSGQGAFLYESVYAKKLALFVDYSKPGMSVFFDVTEIVEIAEDNGLKGQDLEEIFKVDNENNEIIVDLSGKGGHKYKFFSDYDVETKISSGQDEKILSLKINYPEQAE
jgi:hypothetical protein